MIRKPEIELRQNVRDGKGTVEFRHIFSKEELMGHATLYAHIVIPPNGSIGWHRHEGNTEPYYIIRGKGIFTDNDGSRTEVGPGDVCVIEVGQSHSIENPNEEPLEFIALIVNERGKETE